MSTDKVNLADTGYLFTDGSTKYHIARPSSTITLCGRSTETLVVMQTLEESADLVCTSCVITYDRHKQRQGDVLDLTGKPFDFVFGSQFHIREAGQRDAICGMSYRITEPSKRVVVNAATICEACQELYKAVTAGTERARVAQAWMNQDIANALARKFIAQAGSMADAMIAVRNANTVTEMLPNYRLDARNIIIDEVVRLAHEEEAARAATRYPRAFPDRSNIDYISQALALVEAFMTQQDFVSALIHLHDAQEKVKALPGKPGKPPASEEEKR